MSSRPFAYNPSKTPISGTTQSGDIVFGVTEQNYGADYGGVKWWMGPDEEVGYLLCIPVPEGNFPTPVGNIGTVKFFRSEQLTNEDFISLVNHVSGNNYTTIFEAKNWVSSQGFYTSHPNTIVILGSTGTFFHSLALDNTGKAWGWGYNTYGNLGDNTINSRRTPVAVCL